MPRIERVLADTMPDGRPFLQIKDASSATRCWLRFASDGTPKMLQYLVLLGNHATFIGIEKFENFLQNGRLPLGAG